MAILKPLKIITKQLYTLIFLITPRTLKRQIIPNKIKLLIEYLLI